MPQGTDAKFFTIPDPISYLMKVI